MPIDKSHIPGRSRHFDLHIQLWSAGLSQFDSRISDILAVAHTERHDADDCIVRLSHVLFIAGLLLYGN